MKLFSQSELVLLFKSRIQHRIFLIPIVLFGDHAYFAKIVEQDRSTDTCNLILLCTSLCPDFKIFLSVILIRRDYATFADSVEQDQTAHTRSLILLCTLRCSFFFFQFCHRSSIHRHILKSVCLINNHLN